MQVSESQCVNRLRIVCKWQKESSKRKQICSRKNRKLSSKSLTEKSLRYSRKEHILNWFLIQELCLASTILNMCFHSTTQAQSSATATSICRRWSFNLAPSKMTLLSSSSALWWCRHDLLSSCAHQAPVTTQTSRVKRCSRYWKIAHPLLHRLWFHSKMPASKLSQFWTASSQVRKIRRGPKLF